MDEATEAQLWHALTGHEIERIGGSWCYRFRNPESSGTFTATVPAISTDETASMLVVRAMISRGWSFEASVDEDGSVATFQMITDVGNGAETSTGYLGECESLAEAICLAALEYIRAQSEVKL